jgi:hypothetical protein
LEPATTYSVMITDVIACSCMRTAGINIAFLGNFNADLIRR